MKRIAGWLALPLVVPEVPDGAAVRPLLKTEDLRLLRKVFVDYVGRGGEGSALVVELMWRMLRKL